MPKTRVFREITLLRFMPVEWCCGVTDIHDSAVFNPDIPDSAVFNARRGFVYL